YTGKYRQALCNDCNKDFHTEKETYNMKCIFHNLKGYDGHYILANAYEFLVKQEDYITKKGNVRKPIDTIECISQNFEKMLEFKFCGIEFIDSFSFMNESLETLIKNLKTVKVNPDGDDEISYEPFKYTREYFPNNYKLLIRKN